MSALSKETFLLFLPAFASTLAQNLDRRNRPQVLTVAVFTGLLLMGLFPLMALYKGELFPGPGHNSLLGTAVWQLSGRQSAGSLLEADSPMRQLFGQWLRLDMVLLVGGAAAAPLALTRRCLRPIVLALAVGWLLMLRDGYVPYMHVVTLLPFSAILIAGQRALLVLVAYYLPGRGCGKDGASDAPTYLGWIDRIVADLARTKAAIVVEPDAIPADCYTPERARLIRDAVGRLAAVGHYVYIDAGHPKWKSPGETAERLIESGIQAAQGFTINVSNRQTTADSDAWGREVSEMTGGREFLIDTSRNGAGPPPDDPQRDDEWCNPAHQGLGEKPTTAPKSSAAAALLWIKRPGESDGLCGGESTYEFAPRQAANLVANAEWVPQRLRAQARSA